MKKLSKLDRCMLEHALNYLYRFNKRECSIFIRTMRKELGKDSNRLFEKIIKRFIEISNNGFYND